MLEKLFEKIYGYCMERKAFIMLSPGAFFGMALLGFLMGISITELYDSRFEREAEKATSIKISGLETLVAQKETLVAQKNATLEEMKAAHEWEMQKKADKVLEISSSPAALVGESITLKDEVKILSDALFEYSLKAEKNEANTNSVEKQQIEESCNFEWRTRFHPRLKKVVEELDVIGIFSDNIGIIGFVDDYHFVSTSSSVRKVAIELLTMREKIPENL
jgi:hypothetical protein